ncbi:MAG: glycogen synthase GlgA [Verrucomicrobiota bacterium]|jgi:starch synthase|nr:glycogen synthase GlgA [Verrucomicrobiota bacterium]MDP7049744.1 glycogen synthase GlgA [Verrucomicrobiota bacterium]
MNILHASSEVFPYSKTGGLADATAALAKAQAAAGHTVSIVTPLYPGIAAAFPDLEPLGQAEVPAKVWRLEPEPNLTVLFVDEPRWFDRDGLYGHGDDAERFIFFSRCVARLAKRAEIVHSHDWQAALAMPLLGQARVGKVFTIHNAAYQGRFPAEKFSLTGLPSDCFDWRQLEFHGDLNLLKGGIVFSDLATTVSPRYAEELLTPEYGCGLEGVFQAKGKALTGVLNGVDYAEWNTTDNPHLAAAYSADAHEGKAANKRALQCELGLSPLDDVPLFGNISRFAEQKGIDLLLGALEERLSDGTAFQFAGLGSGDAGLEEAMRNLTARFPGQVAVKIGFDNGLAHRIEAGSDFFVMPSRFEPCGLNQLYSLRYGAVPVVRATGGLEDSIVDLGQGDETATGIKFADCSVEALRQAIRQAVALYADPPRLAKVRNNGMRADFSWTRTTTEYGRLYATIS